MNWVKLKRNENYSINRLGQVRNDKTGNIKKKQPTSRIITFISTCTKTTQEKKLRFTGWWRKLLYLILKTNQLLITQTGIDKTILLITSDGDYSEQNSRFNSNGVRSEKSYCH